MPDRTIDSDADRPAASPDVVVVAARDEAERVGETLAALRGAFPEAVVWVADDGSRDRTAELARAAGARVAGTGRRLGKGQAITLALRQALGEPISGVVLLCDADLGASAGRLRPLVGEVAEGSAELAVAVFARSRGGGFGLLRAFARWAVARRCGLDARAPLSGQRALDGRALRAVLPLAGGFGMEVGMTIDAVRAGCRVSEVELDLAHRVRGRTPAGFAHRARQLLDVARAFRARR